MASRRDGKGRTLRKGETYRKDGRYTYAYTDPFGKRRYIYSKNLVTLRQKEEQLIRDQMDGLDVYVAGKATVNMVFDRYISTKTNLRSTTLTNYMYMWNHFIKDSFGKKKIAEVKYSDVLQFYTYLMNEKGIQINSLETINTLIHPTFQLAVRDDIIRKNPSKGAYCEVKKRLGGRQKVRHALSVEEQRAFLDYIKDSPIYDIWYPFFAVMLGTGCRIGEITALTWDDVDFDNRLISINRAITYYPRYDKDGCCEFRINYPKTDSGIRQIPMMGPVYEILSDEYHRQSEEGFNEIEVDGVTNFIYVNRNGKPHNPEGINRTIKRIVDAHNAEEEVKARKQKRDAVIIPRFSSHILRHTFCARFCAVETNIKVIQTVMGHADISTTMNIYAEVNTETTRQSLENLAKNLDVF